MRKWWKIKEEVNLFHDLAFADGVYFGRNGKRIAVWILKWNAVRIVLDLCLCYLFPRLALQPRADSEVAVAQLLLKLCCFRIWYIWVLIFVCLVVRKTEEKKINEMRSCFLQSGIGNNDVLKSYGFRIGFEIEWRFFLLGWSFVFVFSSLYFLSRPRAAYES